MKRISIAVIFVAALLLVLFLGGQQPSLSDDSSSRERHVVSAGELSSWISLNGAAQAHSVVSVASHINRAALLIELVGEGASVSKGEVIARLDSRDLERQLHRLQRQVELASNAIDEMVNATHPLQLTELQVAIVEIESLLAGKKIYLANSESLAKDNLLSEQDLDQTREEIFLLNSKREALQQRMRITVDHLHPAQLQAARTKHMTASKEHNEAKQDIADSKIVSPVAGAVWHVPLSVGGELRSARVGDSIYPNQPFAIIPDLRKMVVETLASETEIAKIQLGAVATVVPLAYPSMKLNGSVSHVGRVPRAGGQTRSQRYYPVTIELNHAPFELLPGMSVTSHILSYYSEDAVLVPRIAVEWINNEPYVTLAVERGNLRKLAVTIVNADDQYFEVIDGVGVGDVLLL